MARVTGNPYARARGIAGRELCQAFFDRVHHLRISKARRYAIHCRVMPHVRVRPRGFAIAEVELSASFCPCARILPRICWN